MTSTILGKIKKALTGLCVFAILAVGSVLSAPAPASAAGATIVCGDGESVVMTMLYGARCAKGTDQSESLFGVDGVFVKITNTALFLIGALSVIMLIYGGIRYTISGGDAGAVTNAKNTILYAIVGIVVAVLAFAVVQFVIGQLVTTPAV